MSSNEIKSNKKQWTVDEDALLMELVDEHGTNGNWPTIAEHMEWRSGKQCRERYVNQLDPLIKKSMWTLEEDAAIKSMHYQFGKKWSKFMEKLPGRSDNAIKNRYHIISRNNYSSHHKRIADKEVEVIRIVDKMNKDKEQIAFVPETKAVRLDRFRVARDILDRKIAHMLLEQDGLATNNPFPPETNQFAGHQRTPRHLMTLSEDADEVASAVLETCPNLEFAFNMNHDNSPQPSSEATLSSSDNMSSRSQSTSHGPLSASDQFPSDEDLFDDFNFDYDELFHEYDYGQYLGGAPAAKVLELAPTAQKAVLAELAALTSVAASTVTTTDEASSTCSLDTNPHVW